MRSALRQSLSCLAWILLSMCAGLAALFWPVDAWYAELAKPSWNPPNWLFGPVWTTLYILIGVSAWRVARTGGFMVDRLSLTLLVMQWVFNFAWSGFFFGLHSPGLALIEISALLAMIAVLIVRFHRHDAIAAYMLVPYFLWVSFATALNFELWRLNP